jgi:hypothetical protein
LPLPPPWLARRAFPVFKVAKGSELFRIHRRAHDPVFFGSGIDPAKGRRQPPSNRFDSQSGLFGVLYAAERFEGAFVETVLRNPQMRLVSEAYIRLRAVSTLSCDRELALVDLHDRGLSRIGATAAISTGPYLQSWASSEYLWSHKGQPDGVAYMSRHNARQLCYAIFERSDVAFSAGDTVALASILFQVKQLLRRYGKILTRP